MISHRLLFSGLFNACKRVEPKILHDFKRYSFPSSYKQHGPLDIDRMCDIQPMELTLKQKPPKMTDKIKFMSVKMLTMGIFMYGIIWTGVFDKDTSEIQNKVFKKLHELRKFELGDKQIVKRTTFAAVWNNFIINLAHTILVVVPDKMKELMQDIKSHLNF